MINHAQSILHSVGDPGIDPGTSRTRDIRSIERADYKAMREVSAYIISLNDFRGDWTTCIVTTCCTFKQQRIVLVATLLSKRVDVLRHARLDTT